MFFKLFGTGYCVKQAAEQDAKPWYPQTLVGELGLKRRMSIQMFMYYSKHQNIPSMKFIVSCFSQKVTLLGAGGDLNNLEVIYTSVRMI